MSKDQKNYHTAPTGAALETANSHSSPAPYTLFGACFCPFVQRVWILLEHAKVPYQYREVDPYKKPQDLLEVSPKGLVPGLKINDGSNGGKGKAVAESTVIMEYIEDLAEVQKLEGKFEGKTTLPELKNTYARAASRYTSDHINRHLIPAFYRYLQAQNSEDQIAGGKDYLDAIEKLCELFEKEAQEGHEKGLWSGSELGWADAMVAPWLIRATNVLTHYRGFQLPESKKFKDYLSKLVSHPSVKATTSTDELYLDSYARYAENRPNTSQVANAINSGRGLP